jgi:serine/threonine protein kinase
MQMGMAEIRDAFEAYASGALAEYELRNALRAEITTQPDAVPRYVAMAAALRRRNLISAELEAAVVSDMQTSADLASPEDPTKAKAARDIAEPIYTSGPPLSPHAAAEPAAQWVPAASTGTSAPSASRGAAWDTQERLSEPASLVTTGLVLRERFKLVEELGRGGMGVVYKALDQREIENRGREPYVAIKVLNEDFKRHPESARALQRESKKSMRLAHPNIVLVRDFDRDRGNVYMVMELLHGQPLDQLVLNGYPRGMPVAKVIEIVTGLGAALSYAHQQGIVHADFKPSNAFLTTQNIVKVLDFGVARVALALDRGESTLFDAGKLNAVSPAYASIELLVGEAPDARDDVYALACVTYFLLTGRHPFNGTDAIKARDARLLPAPVDGLADHKWRALRAALVFERWKRTPNVKEFVAQFCTDRTTTTERLSSGVSQVASRVSKVVDMAVNRPWVLAAPAGALLAAGLAVLLWRHWPAHTAARASIPVSPQVAVVAPAPRIETPSLAQQLAQRVAAIEANSPDFIDKIIASQADVKALIKVAPADEAVRKLQTQLKFALATRVDALLEHDDLAGARKLVSKVSELLPSGVAKAFSQDRLLKRQELIGLITAPEATQHWADQMSAAIQGVSAVAADDPLLKEARDSSDLTFKVAADNARAQQRPDEAREFLAMGLSVNAQSGELTRAALEIATPQTEVAKPQTEVAKPPSHPDGVDRLKEQLTQQVAAGDIDAATKTAATLRSTIGGSATAANDLQQQVIESYLQHAKQQMASGNTATALETIAGARKRFANAPQLRNLEITYDRVEEEVERINSAPSLNVADHQEWIGEIRSLSGDDFPAIEQMLAQTLANDIADQRARGDRQSVVTSLLNSGRKLFPEYAAVLEHGTAGVLDPKQIVIAEEPAESAATVQAQK